MLEASLGSRKYQTVAVLEHYLVIVMIKII